MRPYFRICSTIVRAYRLFESRFMDAGPTALNMLNKLRYCQTLIVGSCYTKLLVLEVISGKSTEVRIQRLHITLR
jgi:hypothetical protein